MPTVCLDCRYIKPQPSGIAGVVRALVDHLPALAPDWQFLFLRHASLGRTLTDAPNVTEIELTTEVNSPSGMWFLPQFVDLSRVDLFHAPANILPRGINRPCITTVHDIMWLAQPELCQTGLKGRIQRAFFQHGIKRALRQSHAVLTVSNATRDAILDLQPDLSGRVSTALSGVSARFAPRSVSAASLRELGISGSRYVLVVGQSAPYKNHAGAMRGFADAFAGRTDIDLVFVHRRGSSLVLKSLAGQLGIAGQVRFLTSVREDELVTLYSGALALLHPSFCEGFGMPLAEAMASGCPVVTSNISAMPEVTCDAALLIDPQNTGSIAQALVDLANESELSAILRRRGLKRAKQLDWREFAAKNLAVYRQVLAET